MGMALDEPKDGELATEVNGIDVLIADYIKPFLDGTTVDYVTTPHGEGFTINGGGTGGC